MPDSRRAWLSKGRKLPANIKKSEAIWGSLKVLTSNYDIFITRGKLTSTMPRPLRKTYRTQKAFCDLGLETVEANAMALGEIQIRGCHNVRCPSNEPYGATYLT